MNPDITVGMRVTRRYKSVRSGLRGRYGVVVSITRSGDYAYVRWEQTNQIRRILVDALKPAPESEASA